MWQAGDLISDRLAAVRPKMLPERSAAKHSAVAMTLDSDIPERASLLFIQRAQSSSDPWSGHMAFPGGRREESDRNSLITAKREMHEEVGFDIDAPSDSDVTGDCIGRLSDINATRRSISVNMVVSPYVFLVNRRPQLTANYEVADTIWLPLKYFADLSNRGSMDYSYEDTVYTMPCYKLGEEKVIWGMTLTMLDEFLRLLGVDIPKELMR